MTNLDSVLKSRDITLLTKVRIVKVMVFPVVMYGCKSWTIKKAECQRIHALNCGTGEDSRESLGLQEQISHPKGNQPWIFIGRTDAETESPILWPPDANSKLIEKDSDAGADWGQKEKGVTEDEMVGWHHRLNGPEFEQTLGVSEGQECLVCYSSWDRKESDTTEWLNNSKTNIVYQHTHTHIYIWNLEKMVLMNLFAGQE